MHAADKRRSPRYDSLHLTHVLVEEEGRPVRQGMGRTLNVSRSGICLETGFPIAPQQRLALTVAFEDDLVDVGGRAAYCLVSGSFFKTGVEFLDLGQSAEAILDRFLVPFASQRD